MNFVKWDPTTGNKAPAADEGVTAFSNGTEFSSMMSKIPLTTSRQATTNFSTHQENGILLIHTFTTLFHLNILVHLYILWNENFQALPQVF
jgi:hypothetical protein